MTGTTTTVPTESKSRLAGTEQVKHTPGPWKVDYKRGKKSTGYVPPDCEPYDLAVAYIIAPSIPTTSKKYNRVTKQFDIAVPREVVQIVFDDRPGKFCRKGEHLSNAHLIAAAPDMLAALKPLGFCDPQRPPHGVKVEDWSAAVEAARRAVAKAIGRTP